MAVSSVSTRRRFGNELKRFRERAGLTQRQLATTSLLSQSTISGLELGQKSTKREHVERLDEVLNAKGTLIRRWESLSAYDGLTSWFRGAAALEQEATEIRLYTPLVVPGLFQTEEYASALIRIGRPTASQAEIDGRVEARLERQKILDADSPPRVLAVVEEAALRRCFGGPTMMVRQLDELLEIADRPHVSIQVLPMDSVGHPGLDGEFVLFTVPDQGEIAYLETRVSGTPIDHPDHVTGFAALFGDVRGAALPGSASREFIDRLRGEFQ